MIAQAHLNSLKISSLVKMSIARRANQKEFNKFNLWRGWPSKHCPHRVRERRVTEPPAFWHPTADKPLLEQEVHEAEAAGEKIRKNLREGFLGDGPPCPQGTSLAALMQVQFMIQKSKVA